MAELRSSQTGLFSAVLTTFIIQSYQLMIPDAGETTNALLVQLIAIQAHSAGILPAVTVIEPPTPLSQMRWVNGLWFAALSCSLSTALISMLAKQWLQAYTSNISGSPHHRARQRQSRYTQLQTWHVLALINTLPLLLHVAPPFILCWTYSLSVVGGLDDHDCHMDHCGSCIRFLLCLHLASHDIP